MVPRVWYTAGDGLELRGAGARAEQPPASRKDALRNERYFLRRFAFTIDHLRKALAAFAVVIERSEGVEWGSGHDFIYETKDGSFLRSNTARLTIQLAHLLSKLCLLIVEVLRPEGRWI